MKQLDEYVTTKMNEENQKRMQDVILWENTAGVLSGELELSDNIYNYKEILIFSQDRGGIYVQCPIIKDETVIRTGGGIRSYSDTNMAKTILSVNGEIANDGSKFILKRCNITYTDNNGYYDRSVSKIIGRYKINVTD